MTSRVSCEGEKLVFKTYISFQWNSFIQFKDFFLFKKILFISLDRTSSLNSVRTRQILLLETANIKKLTLNANKESPPYK